MELNGKLERFKIFYGLLIAAAGLFGSGWVWLTDSDESGLEIIAAPKLSCRRCRLDLIGGESVLRSSRI